MASGCLLHQEKFFLFDMKKVQVTSDSNPNDPLRIVSIDGNPGYDLRCYITGATIQYISSKEEESPSPDHMVIRVLYKEISTEYSFVRIASHIWKADSIFELVDTATIIASFNNGATPVCMDVTKDKIMQQYRPDNIDIEYSNSIEHSAYKIILEVYLVPVIRNAIVDSGTDWFCRGFAKAIASHPNKAFFVILALRKSISNRAAFLHKCSGHLLDCFLADGADVNRAGDCSLAYDRAIKQANGDTSKLLTHIYQAALFFLNHYRTSGSLYIINEAISKLRIVVEGTLESHHDKPRRLNDLGRSLLICYEHEEDLQDVSQARLHIQKAISMVGMDSPVCLNNLGHALCLLFESTGHLADISDAISHHTRAVSLTPESDSELSRRLNDLGHAQLRYHEHTGDLPTITEGITHLQRAMNLLTSDDNPDLAMILNNIGNSFRFRFECTNNLADISDAIVNLQKAVQLSPEGNPRRHTRMSNLGNCLVRRFGRTGDLGDISDAIMYHQRAAHFTSDTGHPEMPIWLNNLSLALMHRYESVGDIVDIVEAISYLQKGVQMTPETHPSLPIYLNNLGNLYRLRFQRTGDIVHISEAIIYLQRAVDITPELHTGFPIWLNNLGISIRCRFEQTNLLGDIDKAITFMHKSVALTPAGHIQESIRLTNLGISYGHRFSSTGDHTDITQAVAYLQKAMECTPENHTSLCSLLKYQGDTFMQRGERTSSLPDIHVAISNYSLAATCSAGPPSLRLAAAQKWAELSCAYNRSQTLNAYKVAIEIVSQLAGLEQTIEKRYANLHHVSDLTSSAAAAAFQQGRPELALEWLEQGRCLVWSQLNDLRSPLDDLRTKHTALADDLLKISAALDSAGSRNETHGESLPDTTLLQRISLQDKVTAHVKLAQERLRLLKEIRSIPEFENFLRPLSYSTLLTGLPQSGIVIVINVHTSGCDAVALRHGIKDPVHIPLPSFSYAIANNLRQSLKSRLQGAGVRDRGGVPETRGMRFEAGQDGILKSILRELWVLVVKPILNALGYLNPTSSLSRIWWCATGPLAFLPIHAAGIYGKYQKEAGVISSYAISSYIPNIRMLVDRVKSPLKKEGRKPGLLLISQADAPMLPRIPGVTKEVCGIKKLLANCNLEIRCLESADATVFQSVQYMNTHSCVHFACHASQNMTDPIRSAFYLHDGQLDLSSIIQKRLVKADLAFLSACQTSVGDEKLSEEAVHLAAGMLAAGYRGVVATMWSIQDQYGPLLAEDFYARLVNKSGEFSSESAACALHFSTQKLRDSLGDSESSLLAWVPYVHFGL